MDPSLIQSRISEHLRQSARVKDAVAESRAGEIYAAAVIVAGSFKSGGKLLICGNGGSAADSQHLATEFTSTLTRDFLRPALPAIALTTDTSFLTAYANDFGFDGVFERQVRALGRRGDVLITLSTSGSSKNVVLAAKAAKGLAIKVIALTGAGGVLNDTADVAIAVPSSVTAHIQEAHIAVGHALCGAVERLLFGETGPGFSQSLAAPVRPGLSGGCESDHQ